MIFIWLPKCSTCQRAKKWLDDNGIKYTLRDIVLNTPSEEELKIWINKSGLDIKSFFNTSGLKYRNLGLKDKLDSMSFDDKVKLLSSDGMLIKRPLVINENKILTGFREEEWKETFRK